METANILKILLPKEFEEHFDLVDIKELSNQLTLFLDEKNIKPKEHISKPLESKGFSPAITINDYPIRDKQVFLQVRKRVWRDKITRKVYSKSFELTQQSTSYTKEFALFLKSIG